MKFLFIITFAFHFWAVLYAAPVFPECEKWFKQSKIDRHGRECFQKCFVAPIGLTDGACPQQCADICQPDTKIWLYFGNGMWTTFENAQKSLNEFDRRLYPFLKSKYPTTLRFLVPEKAAAVAYNTKLFAPLQLLEAMGQMGYRQYTDFFYWLSSLKPAPEWFRKKMDEIATASFFARILDSDLKKQVNGYASHLKDGDAIIVVAHSQGNLYRDEAFHILNDLTGRPVVASFGSVSIATPSRNASSGEIPMGHNWYTTLTTDTLIASLNALRPNIKNDSGSLGDHYFETYLNGDHSGPKILEDTACVLSQLNGVLISPVPGNDTDGCHPDDEEKTADED